MRPPYSLRTTTKPYQYLWCSHHPVIGNTHHCPNLHQIGIRPLILWYSFDSSRLNAELENSSLDLGVEGITGEEDLGGYGRSLGSVDWRSFLCVCAIWRVAGHIVVFLVVHYRRGMQSMSTSAGSREGGVSSNAVMDSNDNRRICSVRRRKGRELPATKRRQRMRE